MQDFYNPALVKGKLSVDRCTFLVLSPSLSLWSDDKTEYEVTKYRIGKMSKLVQSTLESELDPDFLQGQASELFLHHYRTLSGIDIQFGAVMPKRKKVTDEAILAAFGTVDEQKQGFMYQYSPNAYAFRVEYNPNNTTLHPVKKLLENFSHLQGALHSIRIARLDLAIDFDAKIDPYLVLCEGMRKSFIVIGSKGLESVYFGSRQSKNYLRLYNKRQEQIDKTGQDLIGHDRWRLELESKESFFLDDVPDHGKVFRRISFFDGVVSQSDDWKLDFIRSFASQYGIKAALARLPKATASRYRKVLKDVLPVQSVEHPSFIYARDFSSVMMGLRCDIFNACGYTLTA